VNARVDEVAPGVLRLSWSPELQESGLGASTKEVRRVVTDAFAAGAHRIETLVDPEDDLAQRIATFAGLMKEGVLRGMAHGADRIVYARIATDSPVDEGDGFRSLLNSFLPRKRAISQLLVTSSDSRVLLCQLTYKKDFDLPGGVVEVSESPQLAVSREVHEELGLTIEAGKLVLTDWLPPWSGWDDAVCLVFNGGQHDPEIARRIIPQPREIKSADFYSLDEVYELCADFTARRIEAALRNLGDNPGPAYTESGRGLF
jgi:8-oxo-dGTP pyrophosphatase MutT (NUDIX family)